MKELNELTRRLLDEGYTPKDTPPGTHPYQDYYGGWTYTGEAIRNMVWETPCGLLAHGERFTNGYMSYMGVDWSPENNNPVIPCPKFSSVPCPLRDPRLQSQCSSCNPDDMVFQCNCHQTDRPYTFEGSVEELHKRVWLEADELWEQFKVSHKGHVCRLHSHYGRTSKKWRICYDPMYCAHICPGSQHCDLLAKDLDPRKGNVFFDIRKSWTQKGFGIFPDQKMVSIEKGCKLLERPVSLTICEAIVKYGQRGIEYKITSRYHRALFFDKSLTINVENQRAARVETRDIVQDLQDVATGIQVTHAADKLKAAKAQKRARREAAKVKNAKKAEQMILAHGWDNLEVKWRKRAKKYLDDDHILALIDQHRKAASIPDTEKEIQLSLFSA